MSEIKFLKENRDMLIEKIDLVQSKFTGLVNEVSNELRDAVAVFTDKINNKLKVIDEKYNIQQTELENLKTELKAKQFDESNFNNVSMIKNQSKQIAEKENKIRELESRVRYLEGLGQPKSVEKEKEIEIENPKKKAVSKNVLEGATHLTSKQALASPFSEGATHITSKQALESSGTTFNNIIAESITPIEEQEKNTSCEPIQEPNVDVEEVEITKEVKKPKSRNNISKSISKKNVEIDMDSESPVVEEPVKVVKKITKKPIKKQIVKEDEEQVVPVIKPKQSKNDEERIRKENEALEQQRLAEEEEELRLAEEAEALRLAEEEAEAKAEALRLAEAEAETLRLAEAEAKSLAEAKKKEEAIKAKAKSAKKSEPVVEATVIKKSEKKSSTKKVEKEVEKVEEVAEVEEVKSIPKSNENISASAKKAVKYPDCPPNIENLDILELNDAEYYKDTTNNNVYQIVNGDDIGIFLGVFDETENNIIAP